MSSADSNNVVFRSLKPVCDNLLLNVCEKTVNELNSLLFNLAPKSVQFFQSYICFPIELQLMKLSRAQQKQMLIDALTKVLSLSHVDSVSMLQRLTNLLFQQVPTGKVHCSDDEVSEELKLSVVECLTQLWGSATHDTLYDIYTRECYPRLSPVVYMLIQLGKTEKLIKLRVAALECLQVLCFVRDSVNTNGADLRQRARNVIMLMLPGIVSCCASIATEPITQSHKVTVANLALWSRVVCLVMEDREPAEEKVSPPESVMASATTAAEKVEQMQRLRRTVDWLRDTADRLVVVTEAQLRSQTHSHWQVRCQLAMAAHAILTTCARNMAPSVGSLVCCLIVLSEDEMVEVRDPACHALAEFSSEFEHDTGQPLLELVESAFYSLLSRVPRIMQGTDESSQMTSLSLLSGYMRLQGCKLPHVLSSGPFLHRLLITLMLTARLDCSHISLLEDCSIREVENDTVTTEPWKKLLYCNTVQKSRKLQDICSVLWESADLHVITHALLDMLDSNPEYSKEIIFLLNHILTAGGVNSMKDQPELIKSVVSVYLQPRLWDVPFSTNHQDTAITVSQAQSNIVQVSLLAEGLGLFALTVGAKHFSPCLLRCLYPLLECAGSGLQPLASAGLLAVQNVAKACVEGGVTELVRANVDYLSHHITTRLKRAHQNPGVLRVLSVVMRHTTVQVLPCLHEIIEDVLVQSCDVFQEYNASGFLRVFLTFLVCMRGWQTDKVEIKKSVQPKKSVLDELLEYNHCLQTAQNLDSDELSEEEINEEMFTDNEDISETTGAEDLEDKPKTVPTSIKLTVAVLERSLHFLPSKDEQRQILVLDILKEGVLVLSHEEDHLLPIVHKIWSPLVNRFQSSVSRPLVMHRAFLLLCTLGSTAQEFIRSRTLKQVLGPLCQECQVLASHSKLKGVGSAYRLTQQFKLQRALLGGLGELAVNLSLQERDLQQILTATTSYLSNKQPTPLQELCQQLYSQLATMHPDLVWLHLISVWSPQAQLVSPSLSFPSLKLDTCTDDTSEFKKNVSQLLNSCKS